MKLLTLIALLLSSCLAQAQSVVVQDAWVRSTVPGQRASGAFMKITARDGATLVAVSSAVAGVAQVHEMKFEGGVMKMRSVAGGLTLPAGQTVELKPSGYHLMLMDLKAPLLKDTFVALTLVVKDGQGVESRIELRLPVSSVAPEPTLAMDHSQHKS